MRIGGSGLEHSFGAGDTGLSGIDFDRVSEGSGDTFEDGFDDMVAIASVVEEDVEIAGCGAGKGLPKFLDEFGVEGADLGRGDFGEEDEVASSAEIDGGGDEGFVHGEDAVSVAADPGFVSQGLSESLSEGDADIFGGVVVIDVEVAGAADMEVDEAMFGEEVEHMFEEADPGF